MTGPGRSIRDVIEGATLPYELGRVARRYLRATPEYERARVEGRSRAWLDAESLSLGYALAEVVRERVGEFQ
jgi:hypothetical protein